MTDSMLHPNAERLEALVGGSLPPDERAVLESHVIGCARCQSEVEEWRALFSALSTLTRFEPSPGFADRVLTGVRIRRPLLARFGALLARVLPRTTRGWALVTALLAIPALALGGAAAWLFTRPWMTLTTVAATARDVVGGAVADAGAWLWMRLLESPLAVWIAELVVRGDVRSVGAAAALFGALLAGSLWVLYTNLVRTHSREATYVSYSF